MANDGDATPSTNVSSSPQPIVVKINTPSVDKMTPRAPDSKKSVQELENLPISEMVTWQDRKWLYEQTRTKEDPTFEELMDYSSSEVVLEDLEKFF
mmetsp:Transcript_1319/g.2092  ORF Transcript_1319/g.2092 Transcript_1319/m.2092 type:complete len:96 (-) Transcript_1319:35-322(-)